MTPYEQDGITLHCGDCREVLATLPDASVDAVVSDPPYGLAFMGKRWDYDVPSVEVWQQCLRVLKPGGHLLAFAGTRTQHRMACRIEDAGFEIRDMIAWVYGSGFTKGFNLKRESLCKCGGNAIPYNQPKKEGNYGKSQTEHDMSALREGDLSSTECEGKEQNAGMFAHLQQQVEGMQSPAHKGGDCKESREDARGKQRSVEGGPIHRTGKGVCDGQEARTSASEAERLCSGAYFDCGTDAGSTVEGGGRGASHQPQSGRQQAGEFAGVCESPRTLDAGTLYGRGACQRCGKLRAEFKGFSTSLKPALEPLTLARKPLEGTVAANVLQYGTGAINVDGCRVETEETLGRAKAGWGNAAVGATNYSNFNSLGITKEGGRWPANLIHDGSREATGILGEEARFFYCPKTSQKERNAGCERLQPKRAGSLNMRTDAHSQANGMDTGMRGNNHPTVKPIDLMRYLCRMVTPPGGVVLDPFAGSGSTLLAARREGFRAIGIELNPEYCQIIRSRLGEPEEAASEVFEGQRTLF